MVKIRPMLGFSVYTEDRENMVDITDKIQTFIPGDFSGIVQIYVPHTTCGVCVNEGVDPNVQRDVLSFLSKLVPWDEPYFRHAEGNSSAHIKSILVGNTKSVIVDSGVLKLGTWERIFFCEFDGPRNRNVWLTLISK